MKHLIQYKMIILMLILTYGTKNISISDYNNESLYIPVFPALSEEDAVADEDAVNHNPKNPLLYGRSHNCAHGAAACT